MEEKNTVISSENWREHENENDVLIIMYICVLGYGIGKQGEYRES